ncbi:hypothetical protein F0562_013687 [Nyssa sinensis]|uniref:Reverse transcriptase RNase H-like domain-containing protein n=1 Tax=Nyssa sinensis TaxID=561372 RepID=A0A5J4ZP42_9ASTE|nr:hypothetical protein F0562_013687 [Nyssa sinensis]
MGGLKAEIAAGIQMFKPQSLKEAINLARMRDDQLARQRRFMRLPPARAPLALPQATRVAPATPAGPIKRLSWEEMQRKRAQGLCFNCNKRFTAGHRCQKPQLLLLEGHTGNLKCEEITDQHMLEDDHGGDAAEAQEPEFEPEITLHALTGWTAPRTMRMTATMGSLEVVVLIDSGSTHNFISDCLASMLRLPVVPTEIFNVRVANGERLKCQGRFDKVMVNLQGIEFYLTLFSLSLSGLDLVLGIQWLEMLGSVVCNWKQSTMEFIWDNQVCKLQGIGEQAIQEATLKEITKDCRRDHALFAVSFLPNTEAASQEGTYDVKQQDLLQVLHEYEDVFQEPLCVPPVREHGKPIAFMSRALGVTKKSWSTYAKEMLAIVKAIRLWRPYLLGRKFFIQTDQRSLKYFLEQRVATPEQQKWVAKLMVYDYETFYRPGRENSAADALSRKPHSPVLHHLHVPSVTMWDEI